jgi:site-specific DNA-methyltransferase (cytosine-N4-specific)
LRLRSEVFTRAEWYRTRLGAAYCGDALDLTSALPAGSVNAIITSPPFALRRKKRYGNLPEHEYVDWFLKFANEFQRVLKDDGSLVIEIGGAWMKGSPTRSIYQFELLVRLVREAGFFLAEDFYWFNRAKLPSPAQWVNIERIRVKDAVTPIWWLSKTERPKANNRNILRPYSRSMTELFEKGYNRGKRPSEHNIGDKFGLNNGGAIPPNLIEATNTTSVEPYQKYCRDHELVIHPARFPKVVPEFFVKFLTDKGDVVLDPFAGSNSTGAVAEELGRRWLAFEIEAAYLSGSVGRFRQVRLQNGSVLARP